VPVEIDRPLTRPVPTPPSEVDVLLSDGGIVTIRPLRRDDDIAGVTALHERVSDESNWLRFFSMGRRSSEEYVAHLAQDEEVLALIAVHRGRVVALGTAEPAASGAAEIAFLVDDELSGRGLGTLLLEHLAVAARARGIHRFTAQVLTQNRAMLGVLLDAGFSLVRSSDRGIVDIELDTRSTPQARVSRWATRSTSSPA
jgi:GNAT superfamily N-acetyltransferase